MKPVLLTAEQADQWIQNLSTAPREELERQLHKEHGDCRLQIGAVTVAYLQSNRIHPPADARMMESSVGGGPTFASVVIDPGSAPTQPGTPQALAAVAVPIVAVPPPPPEPPHPSDCQCQDWTWPDGTPGYEHPNEHHPVCGWRDPWMKKQAALPQMTLYDLKDGEPLREATIDEIQSAEDGIVVIDEKNYAVGPSQTGE